MALLFAESVLAQHGEHQRKATQVLQKVSKSTSGEISNGLIQAIARPELTPRIIESEYVGVDVQAAVYSQSLQEFPRSGSQYVVLSTGLAEQIAGTATTFSSVSTNGVSIPGGSPDGFNAFDVATMRVRLDLTDLPNEYPPRLVFRYKFCSEEPPSFWGSVYQDYFTAFVKDITGQVIQNIATLPNGDPFTIDNARPYMNQVQGSSTNPLPPFPRPNDLVFNACTGIHTTNFDLSDFLDEQIDLEFQIGDVGDSFYDSAVFIDGLEIQTGLLPNFWVERVEFNQASQSFEGGTNVAASQLVAGKPTVVRAYVAGEDNEEDPKRISATLHILRNGVPVNGSPFRPSPFRVEPIPIPSRTAADADGRPTETLQFYPPREVFEQPGTYQYFIMADPDHEVDEVDKSNNRFPIDGFNNVTFHERMEVNILGYRVTTVDGNGNVVNSWDNEDETRYARGRLLTRNMLPAPNVRFWRVGDGEIEWNLSTDGDLSTMNGVIAMLDDIVARMEDINDWSEVGYQTVVAMFPQATNLGARGWGWPGSPGSLARTLEEDTLPHEIAHNWLPDGSLPGPPDNNHECSNSGDDGFFVSQRRLRLNASNLLCGGLTNRWVSPTTYSALFDNTSFTASPSNQLFAANKISVQQSTEALRIRGIINENGDLQMRPVQTIETTTFSVDEPSGEFRLELRNGQDDLISEYGFNLAELMFHEEEHQHESNGTGRFSLVVPRPANLSSITVKSSESSAEMQFAVDNDIFERIEVSENPPTVSILQPSGGEFIDEIYTIEWEGSDPDGNDLTYTLLYSGDGENWGVIANDLHDTTYDWDVSRSPGGTQGRIRVVASDGVNTSSDLSGIFSVQSKAPHAIIVSPETNEVVPIGGIATLVGSGEDFEDGTLSGESLMWTSDIDGELGHGESLGATELSEGTHTITLTAIDSDGNSGTDTITLTVMDTTPDAPSSLHATAGNGKVSLQWSASSGEFVSGYKVYWGTETGSYGADFNAQEATNHTVEGLTNGTTYYFAVTAYDNVGNESNYSTEVESAPELKPDLMSPGDQAEGVSLRPDFSWNEIEEADSYHLQISLDAEFNTLVVDQDGIEVPAFTLSEDLEANTVYFWHVRATLNNEHTAWSHAWSFTTQVATSLEEYEIPTQFTLLQNYPNPFNPSTIIRFGLPIASDVKLEVYNVLGQRVAILINDQRPAGWHNVVFDATRLSSGIYIYRIQTKSWSQTGKMLMVK